MSDTSESDARGQLRFDAWTQRWVVMAPRRFAIGASRPGGVPEREGECPFCPGHEGELEVVTEEIGDPWRVRAVRNRYPLFTDDAGEPFEDEAARRALGEHEVIVESRSHSRDLADLGADEALDVLTLWRSRSRALARTPHARAVTLFRNKGRRAGSSQPHPHAQLVALPFVPPVVATRGRVAVQWREARGRSFVSHLVEEERRAGTRVVEDADGVLSCCPYASPRAFWARLLVEEDVPRFADVSDETLTVLARRLPDLARRALLAAGASDYNVWIADPPLGESEGFAIEIVPRTGGDAGFELSTETSVCVVLPEEAARRMREAGPPPRGR